MAASPYGFMNGQSKMPKSPTSQFPNWTFGGDVDPLVGKEREHIFAGTLNNIFPLWTQQIGKLGQSMQDQDLFRNRYLQTLDPGNFAGMSQAFKNRQLAGVDADAMRTRQALAQGGVYGQDAAARIGSMNRAADASNDYDQNLWDPQNMQRAALAGMQALSPEQILTLAPLIMQWYGADNNFRQLLDQESAQRGQGGFGGILGGLLGQATSGLDWGKVFS